MVKVVHSVGSSGSRRISVLNVVFAHLIVCWGQICAVASISLAKGVVMNNIICSERRLRFVLQRPPLVCVAWGVAPECRSVGGSAPRLRFQRCMLGVGPSRLPWIC